MPTNKSNFIVGIMAMHGNPCDGHTANEAAQQMVRVIGTRRGKTKSILSKMKRRSACEPVIRHIKSKHRMGRNFLKGRLGDKLNDLLAGCGKNLWKIAQHIRMSMCACSFIMLNLLHYCQNRLLASM